jgi:hypothetical protein
MNYHELHRVILDAVSEKLGALVYTQEVPNSTTFYFDMNPWITFVLTDSMIYLSLYGHINLDHPDSINNLIAKLKSIVAIEDGVGHGLCDGPK